MDENTISKIQNFHYNEGDLIVIYYKIGESLISEVAKTADAVYDALKIIYPDATIIGLPEDIIPEITSISKDDPLNGVYRKYYNNLRKNYDPDIEDDELFNM